MTPMFDANAVDHILGSAREGFNQKVLLTFSYIGEKFVNDARHNGAYTDRTGNLRASVGYVILVDGRIYFEKYTGTTANENRLLVQELLPQYSWGIVLICMAGMGYAAYVEGRGFDVITGSTPTDQQIGDLLKRACKQYLT